MKINTDKTRNINISDFGQATVKERYLLEGEDCQDMFERVSKAYADNEQHAQRIYDYMSQMWFMPATPVLANGGTKRGLPISCFLNEVQDNFDSIAGTWLENDYLARSGGGIGTLWTNIRSMGEKISNNGDSSGVIPFIKVQDAKALAIGQGGNRRGSSAVYLDISHPEIEEFIDIRRPTGGDQNRRSLNIHHGVTISDKFMHAVENNLTWDLISPKTKAVVSIVNARDLWVKILNARIEVGEPYIIFIDNINKTIPEHHKKLGMGVKMSNLCVAPETLILVKDIGWVEIQSVADKEVEIWNGFEWSLVTPRKTGENKKLMRVVVRGGPKFTNKEGKIFGPYFELYCTPEHKWHLLGWRKPRIKQTKDLKAMSFIIGDATIKYNIPFEYYNNNLIRSDFTDKKNMITRSMRDRLQKNITNPLDYKVIVQQVIIDEVHETNRTSDTYCLTEPKRHTAVFNGILTSQCSEITLPTGLDHLANERTAVCCLSSLNLEKWDEWNQNPDFIEDIMRFLDNVLQDFIDRAPNFMTRAKYSAMRERSVGLGVMGFYSFLQSKMVPIESVVAKSWNKKIFKHIKEQCDAVSVKLAHEKGACPDAQECGIMERFSNKIAIAPTANISVICGNSSPGIEPFRANVFTQKTLSGSFIVKNKNLEKLLKSKQMDTEETWNDIARNNGSVQHLPFLTQDEKDVFKTAMEVNQRWLIDHAADRTPFICQAQSLNLFLPADISKKELHQIHFEAWKKGVKSLYYCRSLSIQRAQQVSENKNYEECLSCQ